MKLTHACLITNRAKELREFYRQVLRAEPSDYGEEYVEFPTETGTLAIYSLKAQTQPWGNRSFYFRDPDGNLINFYSRVKA